MVNKKTINFQIIINNLKEEELYSKTCFNSEYNSSSIKLFITVKVKISPSPGNIFFRIINIFNKLTII